MLENILSMPPPRLTRHMLRLCLTLRLAQRTERNVEDHQLESPIFTPILPWGLQREEPARVNAKPRENNAFVRGQLPPERTQQLSSWHRDASPLALKLRSEHALNVLLFSRSSNVP